MSHSDLQAVVELLLDLAALQPDAGDDQGARTASR
jgi:hypothetical protein